MAHNHKLGLCGASLTTARLRKDIVELMSEVRDEIETIIINSHLLSEAPFEWFTVSIRFGMTNEDEPHYEPINKKYRDLPLAIEVDTRELQDVDRGELQRLVGIAALKAVIHASDRYRLPSSALKQLLATKVALRREDLES